MRKMGDVVADILGAIAGVGCFTASCLFQIGGVVASILGILFLIGLIRSC